MICPISVLPGMLDESAPYPLSQERLSSEETGYKSGISPRQVSQEQPGAESRTKIHYDINGPLCLTLLVLVDFCFDKCRKQTRKIDCGSSLNSNSTS